MKTGSTSVAVLPGPAWLRRRGDAALALGAAALALAVYAGSLRNGFVPDDFGVLVENEYIRSGGSLAKLLTRDYFAAAGENTYRPVITLLYWAEHRLWGLDPLGYHAVGALIHAVSAALLFVLARRLFGGRATAAVAAMLFAAHPVTTEAVDAIGFQEDALCLPLMLAAWLLHLRWLRRRQVWAVPLAWLLFAASLLTKEVTVGLPLLVLVASRPAFGGWRRAVSAGGVALAGLVVLAALFLPFRLWWMRTPFEAGVPWTTGGFASQVMITPGIVAHYLRLLLLPVWQAGDCWFDKVAGATAPRFWLPLTCLAVAGAAWTRASRRSASAWVGGLWFLVTLAPAANVFPMVNPMAERYLYVPCAGFCLALATPFPLLADARRRRAALVLAAAVVLVFGALTSRQHRVWGDGRLLNRQAVCLWPTNARGHLNLGVAYRDQAMPALARRQFLRVLRLRPAEPEPYRHLGDLAMSAGDFANAVLAYEAAARMAPAKVVYWAALVPAYLGVNRSDRAADALAKVEALEPDRPRTRLLRGTARAHQGRMADALAEFQAAAAASRVHRPAALRGAGMCLMNLGRPDQAVEAFAAAVHLSSGAEGWRLLGDALGVLGRPQDAADAYAEAVRHDPADTAAAYKLADALLRGLNRPDEAGRILAPRLADFRGERQVAALDLLGWACHLAGRPAEAIRHLDQAVALRPDAVPILVHLAAALEAAGDQRRAAETWRRVKALSPDHPLADDRLRALETKPQR